MQWLRDLLRSLRRIAIAAVLIAILLAIGVGFIILSWEVTLLAFSLSFGFLAILFLLSPLYAIHSADAFDRDERWLIIFVRRRPNRLMQREKGTKPVDFIGIVPPGRTFEGAAQEDALLTPEDNKLTKDHPRYWKLIRAAENVRPPTGARIHRFWFIRLWVRYINIFFDVALVGVRRLYDIHEYAIEKVRYQKSQKESVTGELETDYEIIPPKLTEISNHVRTAPFQWVVPIVGAETKDRLSWNMLLVVNVQSVNPWMQLNNHESWSRFLSTAVADSAVRALRRLTADDVIGLTREGASDEARDEILTAVRHIEDRLTKVIGLEFAQTAGTEDEKYSGDVQILTIEPHFRNIEDQHAFTQIWRADQEAEAEIRLGKAEAVRESGVIDAVASKVREYGDAGIHVQRMQALENAAKYGNTIIFDSGGRTDNVEKLLAMLVEKRKEDSND